MSPFQFLYSYVPQIPMYPRSLYSFSSSPMFHQYRCSLAPVFLRFLCSLDPCVPCIAMFPSVHPTPCMHVPQIPIYPHSVIGMYAYSHLPRSNACTVIHEGGAKRFIINQERTRALGTCVPGEHMIGPHHGLFPQLLVQFLYTAVTPYNDF